MILIIKIKKLNQSMKIKKKFKKLLISKIIIRSREIKIKNK